MNEPRPRAVPAAIRPAATRLLHDVGKYVARTAHNVAPGGWTPELAAMLCRDLFELRDGRASVVCAPLADAIEGHVGARLELVRARALLAEIDGLEAAVRGGDSTACARAAELALAVEHALRTLVANLAEEAS